MQYHLLPIDSPRVEQFRLLAVLSYALHSHPYRGLCYNGGNTKFFLATHEADTLEKASAHWLRHTGIADEINNYVRPLAHVRDDAGHSSNAITNQYNDLDLLERHQSRKNKLTNIKNISTNINAANQDGDTALIWAAIKGHANIVTALLAKEGIAINAPGQYGYTALICAANNGHANIVTALLAIQSS